MLLLRDNRTVGILNISSHLILSRALIRVWSHAIHFIHEEAAAQRAEGTSLLRGSCCVHVTGAQAVCRPSQGPECSKGLPTAVPTTRRPVISSLEVPGSFSFYLCSFCLPQYTQPGRQPPWASKAPLAADTREQPSQGPLPRRLPATSHAARESHKKEVPGLITAPGVT